MNTYLKWGLIVGASMLGTALVYEHISEKNAEAAKPKGLAALHAGTRFQAVGLDQGVQRTGNFIAVREPNYQTGDVLANNENNVQVYVSLAAITSVG
jgi:hypothetical protein